MWRPALSPSGSLLSSRDCPGGRSIACESGDRLGFHVNTSWAVAEAGFEAVPASSAVKLMLGWIPEHYGKSQRKSILILRCSSLLPPRT